MTRNAQIEAPGYSYIAYRRATSIVQGSYSFQGQNVITDIYEQVVCVCIKDLLVFFKHWSWQKYILCRWNDVPFSQSYQDFLYFFWLITIEVIFLASVSVVFPNLCDNSYSAFVIMTTVLFQWGSRDLNCNYKNPGFL